MQPPAPADASTDGFRTLTCQQTIKLKGKCNLTPQSVVLRQHIALFKILIIFYLILFIDGPARDISRQEMVDQLYFRMP